MKGGRGDTSLVVTDFLVVTEEVVPLIVALVLAAKAAVFPAEVFDPLPTEVGRARRRGGGGRAGAALVVETLGVDEDKGFVESPVAFAVVTGKRRRSRRWRRRRRRRGGRWLGKDYNG